MCSRMDSMIAQISRSSSVVVVVVAVSVSVSVKAEASSPPTCFTWRPNEPFRAKAQPFIWPEVGERRGGGGSALIWPAISPMVCRAARLKNVARVWLSQ